jgi:hypothetical protein
MRVRINDQQRKRIVDTSMSERADHDLSFTDRSRGLRYLRHQYVQANCSRDRLAILIKQGGWSQQTFLQFKQELDIIESDNVLALTQYIKGQVAALIDENGALEESVLLQYVDEHRILLLSDFQLLLRRCGLIECDDLIDLLVVSRVARRSDIETYATANFCLNVL